MECLSGFRGDTVYMIDKVNKVVKQEVPRLLMIGLMKHPKHYRVFFLLASAIEAKVDEFDDCLFLQLDVGGVF